MKNGVWLALVSSLVFSVTNVLVKKVSITIPPAEIAFFRGLIGTILILVLMRSRQISFSRKGIPMLALRGVLGGLYMLAYFFTLSKIPLTDASILAQMSPVFVIVLSVIFLKERPSNRMLSILPFIFLGAILLTKPHEYTSYSVYALVGILSAVFSAAAGISIRYLSKTHPSYEIVFYFVATSALVSIPFMWKQFVVPDFIQLVYLVAIGVVSLLGQVFLTRAFTHESAIVVQVVSYFGLVLNGFFGFMFWREIPDMLTLIGGIIIVVGCIALSSQSGSAKTQ
ncbi:DMT family transporter [Paenibacillus sp. QZ-Y1]|uniref:DMT family transporter n=1 Tax=Paenibacillus sp. QZ-Y1 TaxID=3414511 RepID=UPI003F7954FA